MDPENKTKIIITGDNASTKFGGEAILPFHYFRLLNDHKVDTLLVVHFRCKKELDLLLPNLKDKMYFIEDSRLEEWLYEVKVPFFIKTIFDWTRHVIYQRKLRKKIKELIAQYPISIVHQVTPVSPKMPSLLYGLGVPVIMGPMNGGMEYPAGFKHLEHFSERFLRWTGRWLAKPFNRLFPGKLEAKLLLAANDRTIEALDFTQAPEQKMVENAVDLNHWNPQKPKKKPDGSPVKIFFVGSLIAWKGVDYLIKAFARINTTQPLELHILGKGRERTKLEELAKTLNANVIFHGQISWFEVHDLLLHGDVLVLPSLYECGGAAILEGMLCELPVVATAWGGAMDYLDDHCGILVKPDNEEQFIADLSQAMQKLVDSPELRKKMGLAGKQKVIQQFTWEEKIEQIIRIYSRYQPTINVSPHLSDKGRGDHLVPSQTTLFHEETT